MSDPFLGIDEVERSLTDHLDAIGTVFHSFGERDSGHSAYGVEWDGWRYFVKFAPTEKAAGLERARVLRRQVHHSALPRIINSFQIEGWGRPTTSTLTFSASLQNAWS